MRLQAHPLRLVEAAYDLERNDEQWLRRLVELALPMLDAGHGVCGAFVYADSRRHSLSTDLRILDHVPERTDELISVLDAKAPPEVVRDVYEYGPVAGSVSDVLRSGFMQTGHGEQAFEMYRAFGFGGVFCVRGHMPGGFSAFLMAPLDDDRPSKRSTLARWRRVAAHLAAGLRLRLALRSSEPPLRHAEEVLLEPGGRVQHATASGKAKTARERLRHAVVARERAFAAAARGSVSAPDEPLELWRGLVAGRWSLLDRFDADGRRYVVARRNDPRVPDPRALSKRERQVCSFLALGQSNKLIAYNLGLSVPTVANHVRYAKAKLGVCTRAELVMLLRRIGAAEGG